MFSVLRRIIVLLISCFLFSQFEVSCAKFTSQTASQSPDVHTRDFEFDEKQDQENFVTETEKTVLKPSQLWTENDLCKNLQCKPHQVCLVEDDDVAICVSRRKLQVKQNYKMSPNRKKEKIFDEESEEVLWERSDDNGRSSSERDSQNPCIPCPIVKPEFICGSDNHTYSSVCRLEFRNCMHKASVTVNCKGFCPCKTLKSGQDQSKEFNMKERWNQHMIKYQSTVNKQSGSRKPPKKTGKSSNWLNEKIPGEGVTTNEEAMPKSRQNSVIHNTKPVTPTVTKVCTEAELKAMGDRLLDWFSVVMNDHKRGPSRRRSFRLSHTQLPDCKPEVGWMFQHLDTDGDTRLSLQELYDLENDDREHCLRPYLLECDIERDLVLSPYEWCSCFDKSQRPCAAALRRVPKGLIGGYTPLCDADGYYLSMQCHNGSGTCWCVDKHGVEFTNTRRRGRPDCDDFLQVGQYHHETPRDDDQEDDSNEKEGSADRPLDF